MYRYALFIAVVFFVSLMSCSDEYDRIEGKWQLRYDEYNNGIVVPVDSIFYNFQKGTFSAIRIDAENNYHTFFGNYTLLSDKISIILLDNYENELLQKHLKWSDNKRVYNIKALNSKTLELKSEDMISVFRKY